MTIASSLRSRRAAALARSAASSVRPGSAQIARQVAEWERSALEALREGRAGEAAAAYSHHGRVRRSTNPAELIGEMVNRWWAAPRVRR